jgi:hypothetical protein
MQMLQKRVKRRESRTKTCNKYKSQDLSSINTLILAFDYYLLTPLTLNMTSGSCSLKCDEGVEAPYLLSALHAHVSG